MDSFRSKLSVRLILIPVLLVLLLIWISSRWGVWFGNPEEPSYGVLQKPSRVLLTMGVNGQNSRAVSWQYDTVPHNGWLDLYKDLDSLDIKTVRADSHPFTSRSGKTVFYSVFLDSLNAGSNYSYRIRSEKDTTSWFHFKVDSASNFSFIHFGDVQDEINGGFADLFPDVMKRNSDAAFVTFGGDLIERPTDAYWAEVFRSFGDYSTQYPIVAVPGNHEYLKGLTRTLEGRFNYVFPYFQKSSVDENAVFSFAYQNARFFLLDSNKDFWKFFSQKSWLEDALANSTEKWKIVILHHPIYSIKGPFNNLMVRAFFNSAIQDGVDLVLEGHEHGYARGSVVEENGQMKEPLYLVTYSSQKDYMLEFNGDVEKWGTDDRYYQKIAISADSLILRTFGKEHQLYDEVAIVKNDEVGRIFIDKGKSIPERVRVSEWFKNNKNKKKVKQYENSIEEWKLEKENKIEKQ